jgi:hypothetical protein
MRNGCLLCVVESRQKTGANRLLDWLLIVVLAPMRLKSVSQCDMVTTPTRFVRYSLALHCSKATQRVVFVTFRVWLLKNFAEPLAGVDFVRPLLFISSRREALGASPPVRALLSR